jgi:2-polyprenyl-3-methyl-5-hydroxy-6-metoxy-1,4-benzoquinol methylase
MVSLLEHLHQPLAALRQCHALLGNGGLLLLKTVNHGGLNRRVMGANWSGYRPPDHLVYFDPASLTRALETAGFRNIKIRASLLNDSFYCYAERDDGSQSVAGMAA